MPTTAAHVEGAAVGRIGAFLGEGSTRLERDLSLPGPHGQVPSRLYLPNGNLSATFPAAPAHCFISNLPASVELLKVLSPQHWSAENRHGCCQGGVLLDHVSVGVSDIDLSRCFYDATLRPLGLLRIVDFGDDRGSDYGAAPGPLGVEFTITREAAVRTPIPGAHLCFRAPDRAAVDAFHLAALANGGRDDGKPGLRPDYHAHYYGAFVLDPDGHRIEAVCHAPQRPEVVAAG